MDYALFERVVHEVVVGFGDRMEKVEENIVIVQKAAIGERLGESRYRYRIVIDVKFFVDVEPKHNLLLVEDHKLPNAIIDVSHTEHISFQILLYHLCFQVLSVDFSDEN